MKKFLLMVTIAFSIVSCTEPTSPVYKTKRVVILENNTISFVRIPSSLDSVYKVNDTVWVNLVTHKIDDTCNTTMMAVIK
jgi:hypothetical protein